jgi:[acyl-carrier-protein] S-malonyltransferase
MSAGQIAFLFPGQGSQAVGMGQQLAKDDAVAAETFKEADQFLGYKLSTVSWEGPAETLNETLYTQPALFTHSVAVLRALQERIPSLDPTYTAGHSVGEFAALTAAGALSFEDGLALVRERGRLMHEAGEKSPGGMSAVLGLSLEEVEEVCERSDLQSVWVANDNCPGQIVISGGNQALEIAGQRLTDAGAKKVVRLAVSIPAHSPLMRFAQEQFTKYLDDTPFQDPETQIIGNVGANVLQSADDIRQDLNAQLTSRVRWTESMRRLISAGVSAFYELGSGSVLAGLMRRIDRGIPVTSLDSVSGFASNHESKN